MVKVMACGKEIYMDGYLKSTLDLCAKRQRLGHDNIIIVDGDEGIGKTTLAKGICAYYATNTGVPFTVKNIFFEIEDMYKFATTTVKQVIMWDEAALGAMGEDWQNKWQKQLIKLIITCRKYNHFFLFIVPKIRILRRYLAVERSIALVRAYSHNRIERGRFKFYGKNKKETLYRFEEKNQFHKEWPSFWGKFSNDVYGIIDEEEYERKKDEAISKIVKEDAPKINKHEEKARMRLFKLVDHMLKTKKMSVKEICAVLGMNATSFKGMRNSVNQDLAIIEATKQNTGQGVTNV